MVYSRGARGESSVESGDLGAELGDALEAHLAARPQRLGEQAHPQLLHHPAGLLQEGLTLRVGRQRGRLGAGLVHHLPGLGDLEGQGRAEDSEDEGEGRSDERLCPEQTFAAGNGIIEERICPEAYSPVITRAPRTATTIMPSSEPATIMVLAWSARSGEPA